MNGFFFGRVLKNDSDQPENLRAGKCKIVIPAIHKNEVNPDKLPWAIPILPFAVNIESGAGFFHIPKKDDRVMVSFENGDPDSPLYFGGWIPQGELPGRVQYSTSDEYPNITTLRTHSGQSITIIDGKSISISLGKLSGADATDTTNSSSEFNEDRTVFKLDLENEIVSLKSQFDIEIESETKITMAAPVVDIEGDSATQEDENGNQTEVESGVNIVTADENGNPTSLSVTGNSIRANSNAVSGFSE